VMNFRPRNRRSERRWWERGGNVVIYWHFFEIWAIFFGGFRLHDLWGKDFEEDEVSQ
jgi:hypothetical protein